VSWTRRLLVTCAFALMIAGVALMVTQEDELFLALSLAGFALVLVAVPSLPREAERVEQGPAAAAPPAPEATPRRAEPEAAPAEAEPVAPSEAVAPAEPVAPSGPEPVAAEAAVPEPTEPAVPTAPIAPEPAEPPAGRGGEPVSAPAAAAGERGGRLTELSARDFALAGAAAGAALWLWRRVRR
jgi:outer membrane biosynthesis protein TonB